MVTWIIFKVRHFAWVSNLVLVRNESREIHSCVYFWNLNGASDKENYSFPSMEKILQTILGSKMFLLLDRFSGYNQVLVVDPHRLKTTIKTKWGTSALKCMPFGLIKFKAHIETYNLRRKGSVANPTLDETKNTFLRRIIPQRIMLKIRLLNLQLVKLQKVLCEILKVFRYT